MEFLEDAMRRILELRERYWRWRLETKRFQLQNLLRDYLTPGTNETVKEDLEKQIYKVRSRKENLERKLGIA